MKDPTVRLVLDRPALLAYAEGGVSVGETVAEVADEGGQFGIPVVVLADTLALLIDDLARVVRVLVAHPSCALLSAVAGDVDRLVEWTRRLGDVCTASVVVEAVDRPACYILSADPTRYGPDLNDSGLIIRV